MKLKLIKNYPYLSQFDSVVLFSTADWDNPFWTNKQHTATQLADAGFKVLYIESLGLRKVAVNSTDISRIKNRIIKFFKGAQEVKPNLWVFSPLALPKHDSKWIRKLNFGLLKLSIYYFLLKLKFYKSVAWTYNPLMVEMLASLKFNLIVFHSVDDLTAAPRMPSSQIEQAEKQLIKIADLTFVTSLTLKKRYENFGIKSIYYYSNVADYHHFYKSRLDEVPVPSDLKAIPEPRIGFIGAISQYKLDFQLIGEIAKIKPHWSWVLIGKVGEGDPETEVSKLKAPNIYLLGPRNYEELPSYLKGFDAVVLPCPINNYTKAMFPMKFFEYLAAGKMIVASPLPALEEYQNLFLQSHNIEDWILNLHQVIEGQVSFNLEMDLVAKENTWEGRLKKMFADLEDYLEERT
jgi:glycosyltransferase involved in cell wall biosynthesis